MKNKLLLYFLETLLEMGEAALLEKGGFPQTPFFPKRNTGERGLSLAATSDKGLCPLTLQAFEKT